MAVEVYISSAESVYASSTKDFAQEGWELASAFSAFSHFDIIDSYSSVVGRYIGDPIGDSQWTSKSDVGQSNCWIVIRSVLSPISPQWEAKIQWTHSTPFDDPSGLDYGSEGNTYQLRIRFAAHGGWNTTSLDFNPTGYPTNPTYRSSNNYNCYCGGYWLGNNRWYLIADTGMFTRFSREGGTSIRIGTFGGFYGDIIPVDPVLQPMPRVAIPSRLASGDLNTLDGYDSSNYVLSGDGNVNGWGETAGGVAFQNVTYGWSETGYRQPTTGRLINYLTQYNRYDSTPKMDMLPFYVLSETHGMLGTISLIGRGYGPGFMLVDNKNWLATRHGPCCVFKWDGSTDLDF